VAWFRLCLTHKLFQQQLLQQQQQTDSTLITYQTTLAARNELEAFD